jgi:O-antigen/teichoic acid export membrane protein
MNGSSFNVALNQLKENLATAVSSTVLAGIIGLVTLAINTRVLSLPDIGSIASVQAYVTLIVGILSLSTHLPLMRMGTTAIEEKRIDELHALIRHALLLDLAVGLAAAVATLLFATSVGALLGISPGIRAGLLIYAAPVMLFSLSSGNGLLRLVDRFDVMRTVEVSGALCLLAAVLGLAFIDAPVSAYFLAYAAVYGLSQLARYLLARKALRKRFGREEGAGALAPGKRREFFGFAVSSSLGSTIDTIRNNADLVVVSSLFGKEGAGIYGVAKQMSGAVRKFTSFSSLVSFVEFSRMTVRGELDERARLFRHVFRICAAIGLAAVFGALIVGRPLLIHAFGPQYSAAYWPFVALVLAAALQFLMYPVSMLVQIIRGGMPAMMCNLAGLLAFGLSLLPMAWAFGLLGVAIASSVYLVVTMFAGALMIRSERAQKTVTEASE